MRKKANFLNLKNNKKNFKNDSFKNQAKINYIVFNAQKLIKACCKKSNIFLNKINTQVSHEIILINIELIHIVNVNCHYNNNSWNLIQKRFFYSLYLIQKYTGFKKILFNINRTKIYIYNIPLKVRQKILIYTKKLNYNFIKHGIQLINQTLQGKMSASVLTDYIKNNIRTHNKKFKHLDFLQFIKQSIEIIYNYKKNIKGIKIQIKGRFGHKPKGRSKIWKYQKGLMTFNKFEALIQTKYEQAQTKLGAVGITVWIYN
uniref:ribosomal protein S3 n=1 Tax=Dictyotopsis propagulifera TaxID=670095 RepID=UPI002E791320|nr:ribosomal protein S3 [Dictyotopsis propagulifera]WBP69952.1 ribosomal protein S3 [Dictyotopsis propagulifera]